MDSNLTGRAINPEARSAFEEMHSREMTVFRYADRFATETRMSYDQAVAFCKDFAAALGYADTRLTGFELDEDKPAGNRKERRAARSKRR